MKGLARERIRRIRVAVAVGALVAGIQGLLSLAYGAAPGDAALGSLIGFLSVLAGVGLLRVVEAGKGITMTLDEACAMVGETTPAEFRDVEKYFSLALAKMKVRGADPLAAPAEKSLRERLARFYLLGSALATIFAESQAVADDPDPPPVAPLDARVPVEVEVRVYEEGNAS